MVMSKSYMYARRTQICGAVAAIVQAIILTMALIHGAVPLSVYVVASLAVIGLAAALWQSCAAYRIHLEWCRGGQS